ncbi:MAG: DUF2189 domain-containing protein [Acetobacteraceae bacterium]|nr:DUF2189 domain-containing protein [Acetobacteraceae bacterium]
MADSNAWTAPAHAAQTGAEPTIRRIGIAELREALRRGIDDFLAVPTQLVILGLIYPLVGLVAARAAWGGSILPLLYPMVAGLTLMGPVAALGLTELSRRREAGEQVSWVQAFGVLRSPAIGAIIGLGLLLTVIFLAWLAAAQAIYAATLGPTGPESLGALLREVFDTAAGWRLLAIGNLVGFGFALLVLALTAVSFPLLLDRNTTLATALRTSVRACLVNPGTMALWGLLVAALLLLGCIPFFVGLAVVMPVLGHATWHLYRQLVA